MSKIVGYARTSTEEQIAGFEDQKRELQAAGVTADWLFEEQVSSVKQRDRLEAALRSLASGDVFMVTKPDRLARSTLQLLSIVDDLEKRGVDIVILSFGGQRVDTRSPTGRLMITMMGAFAEFERGMMLTRMVAGVAKAKADGKYKGRVARVVDLSAARTAKEAADANGVSIRTIQRRRKAA